MSGKVQHIVKHPKGWAAKSANGKPNRGILSEK